MKKNLLILSLLLTTHTLTAQRLLKDIASGTGSAGVFGYDSRNYITNDTLFFLADSVNGSGNYYQYYFTTGTGTTTKRLKVVNQYANYFSLYGSNRQFYKFQNKTYLGGYNALFQFRNDSLVVIKNLQNGSFLRFFELNNQLYFLSFQNNNLYVWQTDGTTNGTSIIYTTNNFLIYYAGAEFYANNKFHYLFLGNDNKSHVLISDGTISGTSDIINQKIGADYFVAINDKAYFSTNSTTGIYWFRNKLWKTEGDSTSTLQILNDIDGDVNYGANDLFKLGNELFFLSTVHNQVNFSKLNINTNTVTHITNNNNSQTILSFVKNNKIYYTTKDANLTLHENSGSLASDITVFSIPYNDPSYYKFYKGDTKYYAWQQKISPLTGNPEVVMELWVFDGTTPKKITDLNPNVTLGISYNAIGVVGDIFYFSASDGQHGYELWRTDGTAGGTYMLRDINQNIASSNPELMFGVGNYLYFLADDVSHGKEIWRTNGTNTNLFADLNFGYGINHVYGSSISKKVEYKGDYYTNITGNLFRFGKDGSLTSLNQNISHLSNLTVFKDSLFYLKNYKEIWKSDGTEIGSKKVFHLDSTGHGVMEIGISKFTTIDTCLFFTSDVGTKLWKTNGKKNNAVMIYEFGRVEIPNDWSTTFSKDMYACNKKLFFLRDNHTSNRNELWVSNGSTSGTFMLVDQLFGVLGCYNNKIYFTKDNKLWQSDGTLAGTVIRDSKFYFSAKQLRDKFYLLRHENGVEYYELDKNDNLMYLNKTNESLGTSGTIYNIDDRYLVNIVHEGSYQHVYITDGNKDNIKKAFTLKNSDVEFYDYYNFTYHNNKIYFTTRDSLCQIGHELWIWDFECPDGYTLRDSIGIDSTVIYGKQIWGQNVLHNDKSVVYDAKNSIILQPGFEVKSGTTFRTRLIGCNNTTSSSPLVIDNSKNTEPLVKLEIKREYPQLEDFFWYPQNAQIKSLYEQNRRNPPLPISWSITPEEKIYRLDFKIGGQTLRGFLYRNLNK
jgi:trimeric autotransporter adhesin